MIPQSRCLLLSRDRATHTLFSISLSIHIDTDLAVRKVKSFLTKNQEASTEDIVSAVASAQESLKVLFSSDQILIFVKAVLVSPLVEVCESIEKHKDALSLVMKSFSDDEQFLIDALKEEVQNEQEASAIVALLHDLDIIQKEPSLDD